MFYLNINTDNSAFGDEPEREIARILREVASKVERGITDGHTMDANGNGVGDWSLGR